MRNFASILILLIAVAMISGCQKQKVSASAADEQINTMGGLQVSVAEFDQERHDAIVQTNKARLEALGVGAQRDCMETVYVPADYPTIQEAVDWACDDGTIMVMEGTYDEDVYVYKPGLKITAEGEVMLSGGFYLDEFADSTTIKGFNIYVNTDDGFVAGIESHFADNLGIKNNIFMGGWYGMLLWNTNHSTIKNNRVQDGEWGILIATYNGEKADYNDLRNNKITGVKDASGIGLQGDCDYNLIQGNHVTDCPMFSNGGIFFYSYTEAYCDNNTVRNNISSRNGVSAAYGGFGMNGFGQDNFIGPNNTFNENTQAGILLLSNTNNNYFFKNKAFNNFECDIKDLSGGQNVYDKNMFETFCEE
jgi:parallel beta-helix repeat protein